MTDVMRNWQRGVRRHEIWALRGILNRPALAIPLGASLTLWLVPIALVIWVISLLLTLGPIHLSIIALVAGLLLSIIVIVFFAPFSLTWIAIVFRATLGDTDLARVRLSDLQESLPGAQV